MTQYYKKVFDCPYKRGEYSFEPVDIGWRSVDEKPSEDDVYLVLIDRLKKLAEYRDGHWFGGLIVIDDQITHWLNLPEPPAQEEKCANQQTINTKLAREQEVPKGLKLDYPKEWFEQASLLEEMTDYGIGIDPRRYEYFKGSDPEYVNKTGDQYFKAGDWFSAFVGNSSDTYYRRPKAEAEQDKPSYDEGKPDKDFENYTIARLAEQNRDKSGREILHMASEALGYLIYTKEAEGFRKDEG